MYLCGDYHETRNFKCYLYRKFSGEAPHDTFFPARGIVLDRCSADDHGECIRIYFCRTCKWRRLLELQYLMVKWQDRGYDYYKVDWTRPGENGWQEFRVSGQSYDGYMYKNFTNAHFGTYYNFAVKGCISHWYGDSCDDWSPTVGIHT